MKASLIAEAFLTPPSPPPPPPTLLFFSFFSFRVRLGVFDVADEWRNDAAVAAAASGLIIAGGGGGAGTLILFHQRSYRSGFGQV